MKKLLEKDKKIRLSIKTIENNHFVLKSIFKNSNFFTLVRWNAFIKLKNLTKKTSKIAAVNRCVFTINKKRLNKFSNISRHVFLKLIRSGHIYGMRKSSW